MRAFAAVVILAACLLRSCAHASRDVTHLPVHRLLKCTDTLGPSKCLSALASYRAENALPSFRNRKLDFNLAEDVKNFPWERYANESEDQLHTQLCDGTEKLLQYRSLEFNMVPGYEFVLRSNGNGTLSVDLFNNESQGAARGMKKWRKKFYNIVPFLLLPGLIMAAILPFVLPALKMTTVAVGMLNNMALSGAIFTLLRNNAFNDRYDKKVIYVNEGYDNEKHAKFHHSLQKPDNVIDYGAHQTQDHYVTDVAENDFDIIEETPTSNTDLINQYYGDKFVKVVREDFGKIRGK